MTTKFIMWFVVGAMGLFAIAAIAVMTIGTTGSMKPENVFAVVMFGSTLILLALFVLFVWNNVPLFIRMLRHPVVIVICCVVAAFGWVAINGLKDASLISQAETSVEAHLKDPSSARYELVRISKTREKVCGFVNSKNSFGAYAGRSFFIYSASAGSATILSDDNELLYHRSEVLACD